MPTRRRAPPIGRGGREGGGLASFSPTSLVSQDAGSRLVRQTILQATSPDALADHSSLCTDGQKTCVQCRPNATLMHFSAPPSTQNHRPEKSIPAASSLVPAGSNSTAAAPCRVAVHQPGCLQWKYEGWRLGVRARPQTANQYTASKSPLEMNRGPFDAF